MADRTPFAAWLIRQREDRRTSMRALSDALLNHGGKASAAAICEWESGESSPTLENLAALARVFDLADDERLTMFDLAGERHCEVLPPQPGPRAGEGGR